MGKVHRAKAASADAATPAETEAAPAISAPPASNANRQEMMQACIRYAEITVKNIGRGQDAPDALEDFKRMCNQKTGMEFDEDPYAQNAFHNKWGLAYSLETAVDLWAERSGVPEEEAPAPQENRAQENKAPAAEKKKAAKAASPAAVADIDPDAAGFGDVIDAGDVRAAKKKKKHH